MSGALRYEFLLTSSGKSIIDIVAFGADEQAHSVSNFSACCDKIVKFSCSQIVGKWGKRKEEVVHLKAILFKLIYLFFDIAVKVSCTLHFQHFCAVVSTNATLARKI